MPPPRDKQPNQRQQHGAVAQKDEQCRVPGRNAVKARERFRRDRQEMDDGQEGEGDR